VTRSDIILAENRNDRVSLDAATTSSDPSIRVLALGSLAKIDALTADHLDRALTDESRDVRVRAIELAIGHSGIAIHPHLEAADDLVVETAAWALGERQGDTTEVIAALTSVATSHEVSICREAAVAALGAIGAESGLPAILAGLDDRAPVRRRAVLALAPFDGPDVTAALERATQDRDRQVRQAAEDLL
jgi:HEAT repeat protein